MHSKGKKNHPPTTCLHLQVTILDEMFDKTEGEWFDETWKVLLFHHNPDCRIPLTFLDKFHWWVIQISLSDSTIIWFISKFSLDKKRSPSQPHGFCQVVVLLWNIPFEFFTSWHIRQIFQISQNYQTFLPTAYVVREEVIFSVCSSVHISGGGYPIQLMGGGGTPIPGPDRGRGGTCPPAGAA